jgi:hypothetical protein
MLNQSIVVGQIEELADSDVFVRVTRNFKNKDTGEYDSDVLKVTLGSSISGTLSNMCAVGDTIAVKARLEQDTYYNNIRIIAEKVSFIGSSSDESEDRE